MHKEFELWKLAASCLERSEAVVLLVVAESSGSSPGRQGYKMMVGADGDLVGSIGGGVMEVNLVEEARNVLRDTANQGPLDAGTLIEQVHRENSPNASGMICSGKQTVILKLLRRRDRETVNSIIRALQERNEILLTLTASSMTARPPEGGSENPLEGDLTFEKFSDTDFRLTERLGFRNQLYIIGGGHCALALSELMSKLDFHISLYDDRSDLNTIDKNRFAHRVEIIESYDDIVERIPDAPGSYVVVMTLGYATDEQVIRALISRQFKYFGVLGSSAKMSTMLRKLFKEGLPAEKLDRIRTPIGLPIRSHTPEEIAVSIAAEIISVKNAE